MHDVNSLIKGVAATSSQQSDTIGQVNATVASLEHTTQQNASLVEESAAAAAHLQAQAQALMQAVATFRTSKAAAPALA